MDFEPTHRLTYSEGDGPVEEWLVRLLHDRSSIGENGERRWSMDEHGRWIDGEGKIKKWPDGNFDAEKLTPPKKIKKGHEPKFMPRGTVLTITRQRDGSWLGTCESSGVKVERQANGLMGIAAKLCRDWIKERFGSV